jgi:hypothetical protein
VPSVEADVSLSPKEPIDRLPKLPEVELAGVVPEKVKALSLIIQDLATHFAENVTVLTETEAVRDDAWYLRIADDAAAWRADAALVDYASYEEGSLSAMYQASMGKICDELLELIDGYPYMLSEIETEEVVVKMRNIESHITDMTAATENFVKEH